MKRWTIVGRYTDNDQTYVQSFDLRADATDEEVKEHALRIAALSADMDILLVFAGNIGRIIYEPFFEGRRVGV